MSSDAVVAAIRELLEQDRESRADMAATEVLLARLEAPLRDVQQLLKLVRDGNGKPSIMAQLQDLKRDGEEANARAQELEERLDMMERELQALKQPDTRYRWDFWAKVIAALLAAGAAAAAIFGKGD